MKKQATKKIYPKDKLKAVVVAIKNNKEQTLKDIFDEGFNPNQIYKSYSLLWYAIEPHNNAIVEFLIRRGANVNAVDKMFRTPLSNAVMINDATIVKTLIAHGANVNHRNRCGQTALYNATIFGTTEIISVLIDAGADVNHIGDSQHSIIYEMICYSPLYREDALRLLLAKGAKVNSGVDSPLSVAVKRGRITLIKMLLDYGANIDIDSIVNSMCDQETIELLVMCGANIYNVEMNPFMLTILEKRQTMLAGNIRDWKFDIETLMVLNRK